MCVYWEEEVVERGLSRRSQCDAVSLLFNMKLGTVCSLIWSYSAMIFQRLAFWNWQRVWGSKMQVLISLQLFGSVTSSVPLVSHHPGCGLPEYRVERFLALSPHPEVHRWTWDKGSCKSYLRAWCGVLHFLISWQEEFSWISARPIRKRSVVTRSMGAFWEIYLLNFNANDVVWQNWKLTWKSKGKKSTAFFIIKTCSCPWCERKFLVTQTLLQWL